MTSPRGRLAHRSPIPEHCFTRTQQRVGVADTDLMGIVHHSNYIRYFENGRLEYMRRRGLPYKVMIDRGMHLPVVELDVRYRRPASFDDLLCITTRIGALSRVTVRFDYDITRIEPAADRGEKLLTGHVLLACVDGRHRPRALPDDFVEGLLALETAHS